MQSKSAGNEVEESYRRYVDCGVQVVTAIAMPMLKEWRDWEISQTELSRSLPSRSWFRNERSWRAKASLLVARGPQGLSLWVRMNFYRLWPLTLMTGGEKPDLPKQGGPILRIGRAMTQAKVWLKKNYKLAYPRVWMGYFFARGRVVSEWFIESQSESWILSVLIAVVLATGCTKKQDESNLTVFHGFEKDDLKTWIRQMLTIVSV